MKIHPKTSEAYRLFHMGTLALSRAERHGIRIDLEYAESKKEELTTRIEELESTFKQSNFYRHWVHSIGERQPNIYSNAQLSTYLYKIKKLKPATETESGQGATDEDALLQLDIPELADLLQIRKLKKIRDTYLEGFVREAVNDVIHPSFNLHLVRTFRSSSDRPNFQNIPKRDKEAMEICRRALVPRLGHQLMEADFAALEVRIAACYHQDPTMLKYITDPTTDMHGDMAKQLFLIDHFHRKVPEHAYLRNATKNSFVFPQFYGDYYKNCAENLACNWGKLPKGNWKKGQGCAMPEGTLGDHFLARGIKSLEAYTEHVKQIEDDFWGRRFRVYAKWKDRWYQEYLKNGYVDLLTGFRCSGVMSRNDAINYPVQGAAFHCLLWSFVQLDYVLEKEKLETKLIGQIHDSMILDVHPKELVQVANIIKNITCEQLPRAWPWITVPLDIEIQHANIDESWVQIKNLTIS